MENEFSELPDLMTREEAQKVLRIGRSTILKLLYSGELPSSSIGHRFRIKKSDLIDFINSKKYQSKSKDCKNSGKEIKK